MYAVMSTDCSSSSVVEVHNVGKKLMKPLQLPNTNMFKQTFNNIWPSDLGILNMDGELKYKCVILAFFLHA
jgi:hypothetical protein